MDSEQIRILSSMAAENRRGLLFLQEGEDDALDFYDFQVAYA